MVKRIPSFYKYRRSLGVLLGSVLILLPGDCGGSGGDSHYTQPPPPAYQKVLMSRFPISLDVLFRTDNPALHDQILIGIRNGRPEATTQFLVSYPYYNHVGHFPATQKWYLYVQDSTPVSLPLAGFLEVRGETGAVTQVLNGITCVMDITATIHLSYYIRVELGHIGIDRRLVDAFHAAGTVDVFGRSRHAIPVAADTVLGSTLSTAALDFIIEDDTNSNFDPNGIFNYYQNRVNPFFYFTTEVQKQIRSSYQPQLDAMKESGLYPESALDRTYDINEAGTFFGTWFYHSGPLQLTAYDHPFGWYTFSGCIINLLDVARTDRATFWKNANTGEPFGADMIGVFCDAIYNGTVPAFKPFGGRYMVRIEGDNRNAILRLDPFFYRQDASPTYLKVQFVEGNAATPWDDQIIVEYFPTISAAQGSFTTAKFTYVRMYERND
jgi:hypothetical protein